jgi:acyl carrier protein
MMGNAELHTDLSERVRTVIIRTFALAPEDGRGELRMGSVPRWDSLGHMRLVVELEEEFDVSFAAYLLPDLLDVDSIARVVVNQQSQK